jgi:hypothetical protein
MAQYIEFLIHGDDREVAAYLRGYLAGSGDARRLIFAHEAGFRVQALKERIKHHGEVVHVIVGVADRAWLHDALAAAGPHYRFEVKGERKIERAYFPFSFETPSRKVADRIKKFFGALPAGVVVTDYTPHEVVDPRAKGTEVYSPVHEYVFRGKGVVEGDVGGVVEARSALAAIEFTRCDEIHVHHAAKP